jgi:hypothetical protein
MDALDDELGVAENDNMGPTRPSGATASGDGEDRGVV